MNTAISSIRNLGPAYEEACRRAGITSAEDLLAIGADAAYARLLQTGTRPHFIGYYVLVMALQGRPWNDCKGKEKEELRQRFDAIKADARPQHSTKLLAELDAIGVRAAPADLKPL
ncbi:TfoX/Sxy family protein [Leisingera aquaemixtae]|uniref:TfoX/Sxy family protein n=1 Tax=Leisingera aquaemixtae TaxID=1396826 RepID=UPI0039844FEB